MKLISGAESILLFLSVRVGDPSFSHIILVHANHSSIIVPLLSVWIFPYVIWSSQISDLALKSPNRQSKLEVIHLSVDSSVFFSLLVVLYWVLIGGM